MKNFNIILPILLLCTTNSIFTARTSGTSSAQTRQRTPNIKPTSSPRRKQQPPQEKPLIRYQEEETPVIVYSEILSSLKQKTPDSADLSTLRKIKTEVERQINQIESLFARRIDPSELKRIKAEAGIE